MHPGYGSTQFTLKQAKIWGATTRGIQHHKAHFASVLAEHDLFASEQAVLGVVWDGTGYGEDKAVWGGEFFEFKTHRMDRIAHFEYFPWLAGDKMALEPRLSLLSLLGDEKSPELNPKFTTEELRIYTKLLERKELQTSSVGRIFDAVASLLGICDYNTYEGEAAILLENCLNGYELKDCRAYALIGKDDILPSFDIIREIRTDLLKGTPREKIICNFLYTLAALVFQVAERHHIKHIACSGGVFQNATLVDMVREIGNDNFKLYFNTALSPNDENIAFGQMAYHINLKPES